MSGDFGSLSMINKHNFTSKMEY